MGRVSVVPHKVLVLLPIHEYMMVFSIAFVGTTRYMFAFSQHGGVHGAWRYIIPYGETRFVEVYRRYSLGKGLALEFDLD